MSNEDIIALIIGFVLFLGVLATWLILDYRRRTKQPVEPREDPSEQIILFLKAFSTLEKSLRAKYKDSGDTTHNPSMPALTPILNTLAVYRILSFEQQQEIKTLLTLRNAIVNATEPTSVHIGFMVHAVNRTNNLTEQLASKDK